MRLFSFFFLILFLFSGESSIIHHMNECQAHAFVNVTGDIMIEPDEYILLNCTNISIDYWQCPCNGSARDIVLQLGETTYNNYTFAIEWYTKTGPQIQYVYTGSGGSSTKYITNTTNVTNTKIVMKPIIKEKIIQKDCPVEEPQQCEEPQIVEKVVEKIVTEYKNNKFLRIGSLAFAIVIIGMLFYIYRK